MSRRPPLPSFRRMCGGECEAGHLNLAQLLRTDPQTSPTVCDSCDSQYSGCVPHDVHTTPPPIQGPANIQRGAGRTPCWTGHTNVHKCIRLLASLDIVVRGLTCDGLDRSPCIWLCIGQRSTSRGVFYPLNRTNGGTKPPRWFSIQL